MTDKDKSSLSSEEIAMIKAIAELQVNAKIVAEAMKRLEDANEGTVERKGMKERVALAEENIRLHKEAWIKNEKYLHDMEARINTTLREAFIEVNSNVDKKISNLAETLKTQQTFIAKFKPYLDVAAWVVTIIGGIILSQVISGNIQIVRVP